MIITDLINEQVRRRANLQALERYVLTDQWAGGDGWTGPDPIDLATGVSSVLTLIEREFVSRNVLREIVTRHRDGVMAREPAWAVSREKGRAKLAQEMEDALTLWWDESGIVSVLQDAVRTVLYAQEDTGKGEAPRPARSPLRIYVRSKSLEVIRGIEQVPKRATLAEALMDIGVHAAAPYAAGIIRNLDGDEIAGQYTYTDDDNDKRQEITGLARDLRANGLKVPSSISDDATVVLLQHSLTGVDVSEPTAYMLGGRSLMYEMTREPLITISTIQQQKLINKSYSMMSHNMDIAGFTERTLLNAQMPGHWVNTTGETVSPDDPDGARFIPDPLYMGAGAANWLAGVASTDADGSVRYTTPSIVYREPVAPVAFTATIDAAKRAMYEESKQAHIAMSSDATASGVSRIQATNDFVASLEMTARELEHAVRWLLETVVALGSVLTQQPGRYDGLRVIATARLAAVQPTPEDVTSEIAKYDASLISRETAMSNVGVEDVDAELAKIESETPTIDPPPIDPPLAAAPQTQEEP